MTEIYWQSFSTAICKIWLGFACKQHQLYIFYVGKLTRMVDELAIPFVNSLTLECHDFSVNFNIVSALFAHNRPSCRKKSILAKVCFDAKRGWLYMQTK